MWAQQSFYPTTLGHHAIFTLKHLPLPPNTASVVELSSWNQKHLGVVSVRTGPLFKCSSTPLSAVTIPFLRFHPEGLDLNMTAKNIQPFLLLTLVFCGTCAVSPYVNQVWWSQYRENSARAGCSAMCCSGKNSSCVSSGPRIGGEVSANGKCFCDEGCLDMDDCCEDYSIQCQGRRHKIWLGHLQNEYHLVWV